MGKISCTDIDRYQKYIKWLKQGTDKYSMSL